MIDASFRNHVFNFLWYDFVKLATEPVTNQARSKFTALGGKVGGIADGAVCDRQEMCEHQRRCKPCCLYRLNNASQSERRVALFKNTWSDA